MHHHENVHGRAIETINYAEGEVRHFALAILPPHPALLQWMTGNIGVHHVHHLYSRIPFYRLTEVLRDHRALAEAQKLTIRQSLACVKLNLWDERSRRLMSFREARRLYGAA